MCFPHTLWSRPRLTLFWGVYHHNTRAHPHTQARRKLEKQARKASSDEDGGGQKGFGGGGGGGGGGKKKKKR